MLDWSAAASAHVPDETAREFARVPVGVFVVCRVAGPNEATSAHPQVRSRDGENGPYEQFSTALIVCGGDAGTDASLHKNGYLWPSISLSAKDAPDTINGQLARFLNCCFAPGVAHDMLPKKGTPKPEKDALDKQRAAARWAATTAALTPTVMDNKLYETYPNFPSCTAHAAVQALLTGSPRYVIVKTGEYKPKEGDPKTNAAVIHDYIKENLDEFKITWLADDVPPAPTAQAPLASF